MMNLDIEKSISFLAQGKTILCPTDTIWGISCDAENFDAVEKIYAIKQREKSKSLIVLVADLQMLQRYVETIPQKAIELIENTQKPLSIIYPKAKNLASNISAENGSVAIRIVQDGFCKKMIQEYGKAIVSTSANFSGQATALHFNQIDTALIQKIDYVVKTQENTLENKSSKIVLLKDDAIEIIRA